MAYYPEPVARLIEALQRLPGIGPKTAQRLTFFMLKRPHDEVRELAESLLAVKERIDEARDRLGVIRQPRYLHSKAGNLEPARQLAQLLLHELA